MVLIPQFICLGLRLANPLISQSPREPHAGYKDPEQGLQDLYVTLDSHFSQEEVEKYAKHEGETGRALKEEDVSSTACLRVQGWKLTSAGKPWRELRAGGSFLSTHWRKTKRFIGGKTKEEVSEANRRKRI